MARLEWGQTPWDDLSRDELLREVQRMYAAMQALGSVVRMHQHGSPESPYWGARGVGGRALEMERQIVEPLNALYGDSALFRSFFRYALDLLFDSSVYEIGSDWAVCPECGQMVGIRLDPASGRPCNSAGLGKPGCQGVLRPIQWSDLERRQGT